MKIDPFRICVADFVCSLLLLRVAVGFACAFVLLRVLAAFCVVVGFCFVSIVHEALLLI